jgi:hypothetical protein
VLEVSGISSKLRDLICKQTVPPRDNVSSPLTLRQQWVDFSSFIILFDVSKLIMLKKDISFASEIVVESEWVDL